jgi:HTH-type transcriptional regulator/antitoxin HigA
MLANTNFKETFPPGDFLREELEARGWTQLDFARILGRPLQTINEIVNGKKRITAETAKEIALALGTSPQVWLNLENAYQLATAGEPDPAIRKRAAAAVR